MHFSFRTRRISACHTLFRVLFVPLVCGVIVVSPMAPAQEETSHDVVVEADELPSAYGAPPDLSRGRISTLTKSYVLPPFSFELESIYEADVPRHGGSQHLFTQEIEMGLPWRLTIGLVNPLTGLEGGGGARPVC